MTNPAKAYKDSPHLTLDGEGMIPIVTADHLPQHNKWFVLPLLPVAPHPEMLQTNYAAAQHMGGLKALSYPVFTGVKIVWFLFGIESKGPLSTLAPNWMINASIAVLVLAHIYTCFFKLFLV